MKPKSNISQYVSRFSIGLVFFLILFFWGFLLHALNTVAHLPDLVVYIVITAFLAGIFLLWYRYADNIQDIIHHYHFFLLAFSCLFLLHVIFGGVLSHRRIESKWAIWNTVFSLSFVAAGYLFSSRRWLLTCLFLLYTFLLFSNVLYYRHFNTLIPIDSYLLFRNLNGLGRSILASLRMMDILLFIPFLFLVSGLFVQHQPQLIKKRLIIGLLCLLICTFLGGTTAFYQKRIKNENLRNMFYFDAVASVYSTGFPGYLIWQILQKIGENKSLLPGQDKEIQEFLSRNLFNTGLHNALPENRNLILIIVESLESWPLLFKPGGKVITPNIHRLLQSEKVVIFPRVVPQTKGGKSSDCQLMLNTGLLPINDGSAFTKYSGSYYHALAKSLKNNHHFKTCQTFIGDEASYWNQANMNGSLGFDRLVSGEYFDMTDQINMGLSDESFFRQSMAMIRRLEQPFFLQMITLSSHTPFAIPKSRSTLELSGEYAEIFSNYLQAIHYADFALGQFLDSLKACGLFDHTVIVITGDHEGLPANPDKNVAFADNSLAGLMTYDYFIPLIILNSEEAGWYDKILGQIDLYPTIIDLLGIKASWKGLGKSYFCPCFASSVYRQDYTLVGDTAVDDAKRAWYISDLIITKNWFGNHPLEGIGTR